MAGRASCVCSGFGAGQLERGADFERAELGGWRILVPSHWCAAGNVCHPGLNKLRKLAAGLHEYITGEWRVANRGSARSRFPATILSGSESAVTADGDPNCQLSLCR